MRFYLLGLLVFVQACALAVLRPKMDMSMAAAAFLAAKNAKAQIRSPNFYRKAEFYYLKAKSSYKRKFFNKAKHYALLSREFSEKAEFIAIRNAMLDNLQK